MSSSYCFELWFSRKYDCKFSIVVFKKVRLPLKKVSKYALFTKVRKNFGVIKNYDVKSRICAKIAWNLVSVK